MKECLPADKLAYMSRSVRDAFSDKLFLVFYFWLPKLQSIMLLLFQIFFFYSLSYVVKLNFNFE